MFLQRLQGHQNSHFFLATCHFSPGMEKVISFPHTPPLWEQSSFPLRGRVPLPFFTGWTSANENHYWVHSIYLSGHIFTDCFEWREIPFTGHCLTNPQSDVQRENEAENDSFHLVEVETFLTWFHKMQGNFSYSFIYFRTIVFIWEYTDHS